ncbi:MAG: hypothetical protein ACRDYA_00730 [Egibacteraceae bacterium]
MSCGGKRRWPPLPACARELAEADAILISPVSCWEVGRDPADRFVCAIAREFSVPLTTRDERIREFAEQSGDLETVW